VSVVRKSRKVLISRPDRILARHKFLDVSVSHVERITSEPYTRAQLNGHAFQDWETIVSNWEWSHWSDGDKFFTTYIGHSSQGNVAGWIYATTTTVVR
jgi:hypothetical protein